MELNKSRLCSSCVFGRRTWPGRMAPSFFGVATNLCVAGRFAGELGNRAMNTNRVDS